MNKSISNILSVVLLFVALILGSFPTNGLIDGTFYEHMSGEILAYSGWFHIIGAFFLVSSFVLSPILQRLISLRVFRFLGYISFALYLLHPLIIGSFSCYVFLKLSESMAYNSAVAVVFLLTIAICLPLSWLMTKYIDVPGTAFSKYVYERFAKAASIPVNK